MQLRADGTEILTQFVAQQPDGTMCRGEDTPPLAVQIHTRTVVRLDSTPPAASYPQLWGGHGHPARPC